jgi:DNA polymerase-3 subunit epsilon
MIRLCGGFADSPLPTKVRPLMVTAMQMCRPEGKADVPPPTPYLAALAKCTHTMPHVAAFVALIDIAVADLRLTGDKCELFRH